MSEGATLHPGRAVLADFGLGKLGDAEAEAVARHLEGCEACRRWVEGQTSDSFLQELREAEGGPWEALTVDHPPGPTPSAATEAGWPVRAVSLGRALSAKYRLLQKLGRGGMGVVYKAEQIGLNRVVALKVMSASASDNPEAARRFRQEVRAAGRLQHPAIVTAFDADVVEGAYFLVMEYVPGCNLDSLVKGRGALPVATACHLITQAAMGLQHAHEMGMVHRDIKPHNLMVTAAGAVKILDFGLAQLPVECRSVFGGTAINSFLGTPEFVAPEQANDASSVDIRTDLYSLGCTLYFLLAGRPPFERNTPLNTIWAHVHEPPQPLPQVRAEVPERLWGIVARMMAKRREDRYATPRQAAADLEAFLAEEEGGARAAPPAREFSSPGATYWEWRAKRAPSAGRKIARLALAGALVVVLALLTFWLTLGPVARFDAPMREHREDLVVAEGPRLVGTVGGPEKLPPGVLVQRDEKEDAWRLLRPGDRVLTGRKLTSLPGYASQLTLDAGVRLTLRGGPPDVAARVRECVVSAEEPGPGIDADLLLHRGRVDLVPAAVPQEPVVRLRFLKEAWQMRLGAGSRVRAELAHEFPEGGWILTLLTEGNVALRAGGKEYAFTSWARLSWRSSQREQLVEQRLAEAPAGWTPAAPDDRELRRWLTGWAAERAQRADADPDIVYAILATARDSTRPPRERLLGLAFLVALDDPSYLVEFLAEPGSESAPIQNAALRSLRDWVRRNADSTEPLIRNIARRRAYSTSTARLIVGLLSPAGQAGGDGAGIYDQLTLLLDLLAHEDLAVRRLAAWRLYEGLKRRLLAGP
jgi:hypothetical protein